MRGFGFQVCNKQYCLPHEVWNHLQIKYSNQSEGAEISGVPAEADVQPLGLPTPPPPYCWDSG
jgi:hypothetical protein